MEIKSLVDAHNMLGQVMQNLQNVQLAITTVCKDVPELADEFTACIAQMYSQLSEVSDFIIDPDVENACEGNHAI
jgi:hypothetical protein